MTKPGITALMSSKYALELFRKFGVINMLHTALKQKGGGIKGIGAVGLQSGDQGDHQGDSQAAHVPGHPHHLLPDEASQDNAMKVLPHCGHPEGLSISSTCS